MNNTFSFERFGMVIRKDWRMFLQNYGITLLVFCCIPTIPWLTALVFGGQCDQAVRFLMLGWVWVLAVMMAASKIYGDANLPRKGVAYAMLPATNLEKFFSMMFYCAIVVPIVVALGMWCVDTLLAIIPIKAFDGVLSIPFDEDINWGACIAFAIAFSWMISALFMLGNMIFKRRKTAKTFAWLLLIVFGIVTTLKFVGAWDGIFEFFDELSVSFSVWFIIILMFIVDFVLFFFTYRKIKNQKY